MPSGSSTDLVVGGIWLMSLLDNRCFFVNKSLLECDWAKAVAGEE